MAKKEEKISKDTFLKNAPVATEPPKPKLTSKQVEQRSKGLKYIHAGGASIAEKVQKTIPEVLFPTERFAGIMGIIFLAVIVMAAVQFPLQKLMSGETDITIEIGYPYPFLELKILNPNEPPLRLNNLIIDIIIYLLISYALDVAINFFLTMPLIKSKEERQGTPKIYKDITPEIRTKIKK